ncbi:MAG: hypothetical protein Q8Q62_17060, partial [Mesorhizobium sp.]|nr:hypothetical protein [Mesorhizobium sp.]
MKPGSFEEAPQAEFEGAPLSGSVADWARDLERSAEDDARKSSMRAIRSEAGKHRVKAAGKGAAPEAPAKPSKKIP